jgi:hypothetical protein
MDPGEIVDGPSGTAPKNNPFSEITDAITEVTDSFIEGGNGNGTKNETVTLTVPEY